MPCAVAKPLWGSVPDLSQVDWKRKFRESVRPARRFPDAEHENASHPELAKYADAGAPMGCRVQKVWDATQKSTVDDTPG